MDKLKNNLTAITVRTFEELGFLMPIPEENPVVLDAENSVITVVEFNGYSHGGLYVQVTKSILPVLAQNILCEDSLPSEQQQLDALKEVANVICGNILPSLAGKDKIYKLNAPEIVTNLESKFQKDEYTHILINIVFDEGITDVYWFFEKNKLIE